MPANVRGPETENPCGPVRRQYCTAGTRGSCLVRQVDRGSTVSYSSGGSTECKECCWSNRSALR